MGFKGEIADDMLDPIMYAWIFECSRAFDWWASRLVQDRIDEEGCGALICAMRKWEDDD